MSPEQLEVLANEIATFAARIDVARHALFTRLRTFDEHVRSPMTGDCAGLHSRSERVASDVPARRDRPTSLRTVLAKAPHTRAYALQSFGEMDHPTATQPWTRPEFRELNLSAEIGMYVENASSLDEHPSRPRGPAFDRATRPASPMQRT